MVDFPKIGGFNKTQVRNQTVSDLNASTQSSVNFTDNSQNQIGSLPDNAAYRVLPGKSNTLGSSKIKDYSKMYSQLSEFAGPEGKKYLQKLHKDKKLISNNSNDGSTAIENLYKIITESRTGGFDPKIILNETLKILADPYVITQDFGKIPEVVVPQLVDEENNRVQQKSEEEKAKPKNDFEKKEILKPVSQKDIDFNKGHTCPAASIEFDLADKKPAEFVRYIERLTSPDKCVKTKIKYSNIADDMPAAVSKLTDWKIDYQRLNADNIEITLRADENAYPRAIIQEYGKVKDSRSAVDSLLQSAFMQAGSQKTYNSLTDLRSEDTGNGRGLNQEEGAFIESIVDYEGGKDSVTYMDLDENLTKINKYNFDPKTTEAQLTETLNRGKNIMIGFLTDVDEKGNLVTPNGHEVLLTGIVQDKTGEKYFQYQDSDDGNHYAPSYIKAGELIRTLHHANIPKDIIRKYIPPQHDARLSLIADYWMLKKQNSAVPVQQVQA